MSVKNMDLNPGGLIGALIGLGFYGAYVYTTFAEGDEPLRATGKVLLPILFVGGLAGNYLWSAVVKPKKNPEDDV